MAERKPATTTKKTAPKPKKAAATKAKKTTSKTKSPAPLQSFRLSQETQKFVSSNITRQTVYWTILAIFILVIGIYVVMIQLDILYLLEQIERNALAE